MNARSFHRQFGITSHQSLRPLVPLPSPREAHLWYVIPSDLKSSSLLNDYMEILSPSEKANVLSFGDDELKKRALLARALIRTTIARYQINNDVSPKSLVFKKNLYGKPEVNWNNRDDWNPPPLHFNISHTSSLIACGITMGSTIGIDVEEKNRKIKTNVLAFARRFLSPLEVDILAAIPDLEVQRQEFIKLWTLKEAYVKALGKGFSASPFKTFSIHLQDPRKSAIKDADFRDSEVAIEAMDDMQTVIRKWQFALVDLAGTHYGAICLEKDKALQDAERHPVYLKAWKTTPFVEDECVTGTSSVVTIGGFIKQIR
ncbi:hypothetical protein V2J09_001530 [Rumex salicifolius]